VKTRSFWASLHDAACGVVDALASQRNMKIHLIAAILVVAAGLFMGLNRLEWSVIILTITAVWAAEIMNTSLERVVDLLSPQYNALAGQAKNLGAGAVLVTALGAVLVGIMIFGPRLIHWLEGFSQ